MPLVSIRTKDHRPTQPTAVAALNAARTALQLCRCQLDTTVNPREGGGAAMA